MSETIYGVWFDDNDFPEDSQAEYVAYFTTHAAAEAFILDKIAGNEYTRVGDHFEYKSATWDYPSYTIEPLELRIK